MTSVIGHARRAVFGVFFLAASTPLCAQEEFDFEKEGQFWSFRILQEPLVPEARGEVDTAVDAFVLEKLDAKGLTFSPAADRRTLLRRAFLDLVGLPPTPDEIEAYLADESSGAYERLIDRLLNSSHFGERWGQHWLDAVGFVTDRPTRWQYRDYVINAFNSDKPYDRFLVEQIAGDELVDWRNAEKLTPEMREVLIATGLLRTASDNTGNVMTDILSYRYEILFDTLEVLGTGVLGLTLQCARCHTHKYDPIPQRDFYRMMALFTPAYNLQKWLRNGDRELPEKIDGLYDIGPPPGTHLLVRGDIESPGPKVRAGFLRALSLSDETALAPQVNTEAQGATSGRRLAFGRWLTRGQTPAAGLVARVWVNRIWHHLFGRGIVRTPGNLGHSGERPTHPELIDYLASEFVRGGWRIKPIVKLVMLSRVYRQVSTGEPPSQDPENRLWWRMPLRRVESEVIRDSMLAASGKLDRTMLGPAIPIENLPNGATIVKTKDLPTPTSQWRRSIYLANQRVGGLPYPTVTLLSVFDQPLLTSNCTKRRTSAVVTQSLTLLNDPFVLEQADYFAARLIQEATAQERVDLAFRIALGRSPTAEESKWSDEFLSAQRDTFRSAAQTVSNAAQAVSTEATSAEPTAKANPERQALASLCHAIFSFNNFLYVE